ncbi:MAG: general secretion pathway protein GspK, partial [Proteobacteria bacterium]|nr:general secretion pathway protein GspK [Pseudomonadota bacterium]
MKVFFGKFFRRSDAGEKGFALLAVLVILAILTPLVVNFSYSARVQMAGADYFSSKIKSREVARAGLESAIQALKRDNEKYDAFNEDWGRFAELSQFSGSFFDEGSFAGRIDDEEGKLNINDLVSSGAPNPVMVEQVERFFELKDINIDLIDGIIDWLDEDSETKLMGAETDYYNTLDNPYNA